MLLLYAGMGGMCKMPVKLKKIFEKEYGKKKGDNIFYAWENKHKKRKVKR